MIAPDCHATLYLQPSSAIFSHLQPFSCFGSLLCPLCLLCYVQMTCDECQRHPLPGAIEPMAGEAGPSPGGPSDHPYSIRSQKIHEDPWEHSENMRTPWMEHLSVWNMSEKEVVNSLYMSLL